MGPHAELISVASRWEGFSTQPLLFSFVAVVFVVAAMLGFSEEGRLFVEMLIPAIRRVKRERSAWQAVWSDLRRELSTWDVGDSPAPEKRDNEGSKPPVMKVITDPDTDIKVTVIEDDEAMGR